MTLTLLDGRQITIRRACPDDAEQIVKAVDAVSRELRWFLRGSFDMSPEEERSYLTKLNPQNEAYFVAMSGEQLVGFLTIGRDRHEFARHTAEFSMGLVEPYRGLGIGKGLLESALEWAKSVGVEKVCLGVRVSNQQAIHLYTKLGFVEEGRRSRYVKTPEGYDDDILMARFI